MLSNTVLEKEAHDLWCPFARVPGGIATDAPVNRTREGDPRAGTMCIGDKCMAWRWYNDPDDGNKRRGYCGLVGKP